MRARLLTLAVLVLAGCSGGSPAGGGSSGTSSTSSSANGSASTGNASSSSSSSGATSSGGSSSSSASSSSSGAGSSGSASASSSGSGSSASSSGSGNGTSGSASTGSSGASGGNLVGANWPATRGAVLSSTSDYQLTEIQALDYDHDGNLDIVGIARASVALFHGNGDGTFAPVVVDDIGSLSVNSSVNFVRAKFGGARWPDIVATYSQQPPFAALIRLGDGGGALSGQPLSLDRQPETFAGGDLDDDGLPDLAFSVEFADGGQNISVLFQEPDGGFAPTQNVSTGEMRMDALAIGDVDGDRAGELAGIFDEVDAGRVVGTGLALVRGLGGRAFAAPAEVARTGPAAGTPFVQPADLKNDGHAEMLLGGFALPGAGYATGLSDGGLAPEVSLGPAPPTHAPYEPFEATRLALGDFNEDGLPDAAVYGSWDLVELVLSDGLGGYQQGDFYAVTADAMAAGDFNRDGHLDLAVAHGGQLAVYFGDGHGHLSAPSMQHLYAHVATMALADIDGDGHLDLVVDSSDSTGDSKLYFYAGLGDGTFADPVALTAGTSDNAGPLLAADFNHDGYADIVGPLQYASGLFACCSGLYLLDGSPTGLGSATRIPSGGSYGLTLGDFNEDGYPDLASSNGVGVSVTLVLADGGVASGGGASAVSYMESYVRSGRFAGPHQDLVYLKSQAAIDLLPGFGDGGFGSPYDVHTGSTIQGPLTAGDIDGDGLDDFTSFDQYFQQTEVYLANGDGGFRGPIGQSFGPGNATTLMKLPGQTRAAMMDLANGAVEIRQGLADGGFDAVQRVWVGNAASAFAVGDLDGDGKADLVIGGSGIDVVRGQ